MNKVLVLPSIGQIQKIKKFLKDEIEIIKGSYRNLCITIDGEKVEIYHNNINIDEYDFVWLTSTWSTRDLGSAVDSYLNNKNKPHTKVEFASSKITDHITLAQKGVKQPKTFYAYKKYTTNNLEKVEKLCNYPIIIKHKKEFGGKLTQLAKNREELIQIISQLPNNGFFLQEFIPNNFDWGINVSNNKVVAASKRSRNSGFLNNACQGSTETFIEPAKVPEIIKKCALKSARNLDLNWTRADIIYNENTERPLLLEMNRYPGMTTNSPEVKAFANFLENEIGNSNLQ